MEDDPTPERTDHLEASERFVQIYRMIIHRLRDLRRRVDALEDLTHQLDALVHEKDISAIVGSRDRFRSSLRKMVADMTRTRPMTKAEILTELQNRGYPFTTANPVNSLNVILYGRNPKFKREGDRFLLDSTSETRLEPE